MRCIVVLYDINPTTMNERIEEACILYKTHDTDRIILSGGRFRSMSESYASIMNKIIIRKGIMNSILEERSLSDIESAIFVRKILKNEQVTSIHVITSDFHVPRASVIFLKVLKGYRMSFIASRSRTIIPYEPTDINMDIPDDIYLNVIEEVKRGYIKGVSIKNTNIVDYNGMNALHWSCYMGFNDITHLLLNKCNLDPNVTVPVTDITPLHYALYNSNICDAWELLRCGADTDISAIDHSWIDVPRCTRLTAMQLIEYMSYNNRIIMNIMMMTNDVCINYINKDDSLYIKSYIQKFNIGVNIRVFVAPNKESLDIAKNMGFIDVIIEPRLYDKNDVPLSLSEMESLYPFKFDHRIFEEDSWWSNCTDIDRFLNTETHKKLVICKRTILFAT
jgi:hypothetical protein